MTVQNAIVTTVVGKWVFKYTVSLAFKNALTLENTCSIGLCSGE